MDQVASWEFNGSILKLFNSEAGFSATLSRRGLTSSIGEQWLRGLPAKGSLSSESLRAYFQDTYIRIKGSDTSPIVNIFHRLRGGNSGPTPIVTARWPQETTDKFIEAIQTAEAVRLGNEGMGLDLVAVVGGTRVGKSTLINSLTGTPYEYDSEDGDAVRPVRGAPELAEARGGHDGVTLNAKVYQKGNGTHFLDAGGWHDLDPFRDMIISTSIKHSLENARSVRLLCCLQCSVLFTGNMSEFIDQLKGFASEFIAGERDIFNATLFVITQPEYNERTETNISIEDVRARLQVGLNSSDLNDEYKGIIRFVRDRIVVFDPTDQNSVTGLRRQINSLARAHGTRGRFGSIMSANAIHNFVGGMSDLAEEARKIYNDYLQLDALIQTTKEEIAKLRIEEQTYQNSLDADTEAASEINKVETRSQIEIEEATLRNLQGELTGKEQLLCRAKESLNSHREARNTVKEYTRETWDTRQILQDYTEKWDEDLQATRNPLVGIFRTRKAVVGVVGHVARNIVNANVATTFDFCFPFMIEGYKKSDPSRSGSWGKAEKHYGDTESTLKLKYTTKMKDEKEIYVSILAKFEHFATYGPDLFRKEEAVNNCQESLDQCGLLIRDAEGRIKRLTKNLNNLETKRNVEKVQRKIQRKEEKLQVEVSKLDEIIRKIVVSKKTLVMLKGLNRMFVGGGDQNMRGFLENMRTFTGVFDSFCKHVKNKFGLESDTKFEQILEIFDGGNGQ